MASADQAAGLLQNLSLDSQAKNLDITEPTKKPSIYQYGSVDPANVPNVQIPTYERSITPVLPDFIDPAMCYSPNLYPYYYGGYDGTGTGKNDWEKYSRMMSADGGDMNSGVYGDNNGSVMYHHGYGYPPYSPYSPVASPNMGNDAQQLYQLQQYRYPPYFQPLKANSAPYTPISLAPQATIPADQKPSLPVETVNLNSNLLANGGVVNKGSVPLKSSYQSSFQSNNSYRKSEYPGPMSNPSSNNPRFGLDSLPSPNSWMDGSTFSEGQQRPLANSGINSFSKATNIPTVRNQHFRPNPQYNGFNQPGPLSGMMGTPQGYTNSRMYPTKTYGQYGNSFRSGMGYGSNLYDSRSYGRGWSSLDAKSRARGRGYPYGPENADASSELNRGPRGNKKTQKGLLPVTDSVNGQDAQPAIEENNDKTSIIQDKDQYSGEGFSADYDNAKFFIIKSYSEDDLHKSFKYNIWTSTNNGNKKLDAAYQEAQKISGGCPVFLFFSVNTSGQFVGLAEMVGPVDFEKSCEYWQQDNKWTGSFPVKWHIVKDVPNTLLKHITLENNENKPVTNSRDSQEVKLEHGLKMIKIFKDHVSPTCLLDDIKFYEEREKSLQEKKAKQLQFQKQVWEGKNADEVANGEQLASKDPTSVAPLSNEDVKIAENGAIANGC